MIFILFLSLLTIVMSNTAFGELTVFPDKQYYFLKDTMFLEGQIDFHLEDYDDIIIKIINLDEDIILNEFVKLQNDGSFYHQISLRDLIWDEDGLYRIETEYEHHVTSNFFYFSQSLDPSYDNSTLLSLDKDVYSWIDTIEITLIAPLFNIDKNKIEKIDSGKCFIFPESKSKMILKKLTSR